MGEGHVAKGGTTWRHGKSCFPHLTLVFHADSKPSSSAVQPPPSYLCLLLQVFFPFSFFPLFIQTCQLWHCHHLHLALHSHRQYLIATTINPIGANSTLQLQHQPHGCYNCHHITPCGHTNHLLHPPSHVLQAHTSHPVTIAITVPCTPIKAPDKSFPFLSSFIFNGAGHPPCVTLPLNVSLDLGLVRGAQHDLAIIDTDHLLVTCYGRSQGPMTLGREMPLTRQKGQE